MARTSWRKRCLTKPAFAGLLRPGTLIRHDGKLFIVDTALYKSGRYEARALTKGGQWSKQHRILDHERCAPATPTEQEELALCLLRLQGRYAPSPRSASPSGTRDGRAA